MKRSAWLRWLVFADPAGGFTATLLVAPPSTVTGPLTGFTGRWVHRDGLVITAIAVPAWDTGHRVHREDLVITTPA